jgi:nucleotide-binding universal stress UspA family protein
MAHYQRIFVALDQSRLEESVFEAALALAVANQAQLKFFHCSTVPSATAMEFGDRYRGNVEQFLAIAQQQLDREMEESKQWLSSIEAQAKEAGVETSWDWATGEPGPQIRHHAKEWQADLIVLGRRGRSGLAEVFLGSVSNYVLHRAHCSVLVVQGKYES